MSGKVPVRRDQLRPQLTAFMAWLVEQGAEVGKPTNPYEVLRYRAYWRGTKTAATHVIYAKESGLLTWTGGSLGHFRAFLDGLPLDEFRPTVPPTYEPERKATAQNNPFAYSKSDRVRAKLLARDGAKCWFCGLELGADITIEHLVPKSKGGSNRLDNYALAHQRCNARAADMPLVQKIELRATLHAQVSLPRDDKSTASPAQSSAPSASVTSGAHTSGSGANSQRIAGGEAGDAERITR